MMLALGIIQFAAEEPKPIEMWLGSGSGDTEPILYAVLGTQGILRGKWALGPMAASGDCGWRFI